MRSFALISLLILSINVLKAAPPKQNMQYLNVIEEEYPDILPLCDRFRQIDALSQLPVQPYGSAGSFSPTTLRYIKIAGDIKREFGDLRERHIVEIGGDYWGLCKILAEYTGFARYTIIDSKFNRDLINEAGIQNVRCINSDELDQLEPWDLVINCLSFSEMEFKDQTHYLEKLIQPAPRGYMIFPYSPKKETDFLTIDDFLIALFTKPSKGRLQPELPVGHPDHYILAWKPPSEVLPSSMKEKVSISAADNLAVITNRRCMGRLGDNLVSYCHAKWLARKYGFPFIYSYFPQAEAFKLSELDPSSKSFSSASSRKISKKKQIFEAQSSTVMIIPYFPENRLEYEKIPDHRDRPYFFVDWEDTEFRKEIIECLSPKKDDETAKPPEGYLSIAVHVRKGGTFDNTREIRCRPLKFPPDAYYIEQIERIARIYKDRPIYVYIFTDDLKPEEITKSFAAAVNNPRIVFAHGPYDPSKKGLFYDFYSLKNFDCLIRSTSSFSFIGALLGNYKIAIAPTHYVTKDNEVLIDKIEMTFNN